MSSSYKITKDNYNTYFDFTCADHINNILIDSIINTNICNNAVLINNNQIRISTHNVLNLKECIDIPSKIICSYDFFVKVTYDLSMQLKYLIEKHKKKLYWLLITRYICY